MIHIMFRILGLVLVALMSMRRSRNASLERRKGGRR